MLTAGSTPGGDRGTLEIAERILDILGEGRFSATYKFAVLAGLMDLCMERTESDGAAPNMVTTRQLATKIIELYWPQTARFARTSAPNDHDLAILRQGGNSNGEQAEIVGRIVKFRESLQVDPQCPLERARRTAPDEWRRLVDFVEWKLIEYPLPRLQRVGKIHDEFLYKIGWDTAIAKACVSEYQRDGRGTFDNRILLLPCVGEALVRLHGLLRPLLHRQWASKVAELNGLEESRLEEFLFGAERIALEPVRDDLRALHDDRCFYCDDRLSDAQRRRLQIDHFVPWSRHPENAIENLVPAHEQCNGDKGDFLAARVHARRWRERMERRGSDLRLIAERAGFEHAPSRVLSIARSIYLRLPARALLWVHRDNFEAVGDESFSALLAARQAG